jgi:hypothetical protein
MSRRASAPSLAAGVALAVAAAVVLRLVRGDALWSAGEGIYGLTARRLLEGGDLYGDIAVAQPPLHFAVGAALLAVEDSLGGLRTGVGLLQLVSAGLAGAIAWRLTASRAATVLAPAATLLLPWNVHEHAVFIPEHVAMPLLLGAALLASRERTAVLAGALAACAVAVKLPLALAVLGLLAGAAARRRFATGGLVAGAALAVVFGAIFGSGLWEHLVTAQADTGWRALDDLAGAYAQLAWNLLPLLVWVPFAVLPRAAADRRLLATTAGLFAGLAATLLTLTKNGTGLYVAAAVEVAAVPLAGAGIVALLRRGRRRGLVVAAGAAAGALLLVQSASLVAAPERPRAFVRPGASIGYAVGLTDAQVDRMAAQARACPPGVPYSGQAFVALLARRPMPGDQPDTFIVQTAETHRDLLARVRADGDRCP